MKFISITPENNNASEFITITDTMPSFVKLYSPGCSHCVAMQKAWDSLKNNPELKDYNMAIIEVHADELNNINSPAMSANGFPTIRKVLKHGKLGKDYNGDRSTKDMINFIKNEFKETLMKGGNMRSGHMRSKKQTTKTGTHKRKSIKRKSIKRKRKSIKRKQKRL
jgi:hypothetical protein